MKATKPGRTFPSFDIAIESTPKGVKVRIDAIYVYPDGHADFYLPDLRNGGGMKGWPSNNPYDSIQFATRLLARMHILAERKAKLALKTAKRMKRAA